MKSTLQRVASDGRLCHVLRYSFITWCQIASCLGVTDCGHCCVRQTFRLDHVTSVLVPSSLPDGELIPNILSRVLCLPSVASKRYLTNKVLHLHSRIMYHTLCSVQWIDEFTSAIGTCALIMEVWEMTMYIWSCDRVALTVWPIPNRYIFLLVTGTGLSSAWFSHWCHGQCMPRWLALRSTSLIKSIKALTRQSTCLCYIWKLWVCSHCEVCCDDVDLYVSAVYDWWRWSVLWRLIVQSRVLWHSSSALVRCTRHSLMSLLLPCLTLTRFTLIILLF